MRTARPLDKTGRGEAPPAGRPLGGRFSKKAGTGGRSRPPYARRLRRRSASWATPEARPARCPYEAPRTPHRPAHLGLPCDQGERVGVSFFPPVAAALDGEHVAFTDANRTAEDGRLAACRLGSATPKCNPLHACRSVADDVSSDNGVQRVDRGYGRLVSEPRTLAR